MEIRFGFLSPRKTKEQRRKRNREITVFIMEKGTKRDKRSTFCNSNFNKGELLWYDQQKIVFHMLEIIGFPIFWAWVFKGDDEGGRHDEGCGDEKGHFSEIDLWPRWIRVFNGRKGGRRKGREEGVRVRNVLCNSGERKLSLPSS